VRFAPRGWSGPSAAGFMEDLAIQKWVKKIPSGKVSRLSTSLKLNRPSPWVSRFVANLVALGEAWKGTAAPIRLVGWTLSWILVTMVLGAARWAGVVPAGVFQHLQILLTYARRW